MPSDDDLRPPVDELPYPSSLCHRCAAPPRYLRGRSTWFVMCPVVPEKYPPQPVVRCPWFRPRDEASGGLGAADDSRSG